MGFNSGFKGLSTLSKLRSGKIQEYCILRQIVVSIEHMVKEHGSATNQNIKAAVFGRVQLFEMTLSFALLHAGKSNGVCE